MTQSDPLNGPKLKVGRAKRHLDEFKAALKAFYDSNPYELVTEDDLNAGEEVVRIRVHKCLPSDLNVIVGDAVHNLRSALDQLVCALVRVNRKQVSSGNGFPISGSVKSFEKACIGKLKNVSPKADRFIRRLKPYQGGNHLLWTISELDNLDKHNAIVPVTAGNAQPRAKIGMPNVFIAPNGNICLFGGPPGSQPFGFEQGYMIPEGNRPVKLIYDNCEIYRSKLRKAGFREDLQVTIQITFGKTSVTDNESIEILLTQLIEFVDRTINIVERRIL